jgi:hypothetical protein
MGVAGMGMAGVAGVGGKGLPKHPNGTDGEMSNAKTVLTTKRSEIELNLLRFSRKL